MARKLMNIVDVMAWLEGVRMRLVGLRVGNVYQDKNNNLIIFKLKGLSPYVLLIEEGKRIHLSRRVSPTDTKLTPFVMILRKEIRGKKISSVLQINNDRIVLLDFGERLLITELLPRGIISLTDKDNFIIAASSYIKTKDRSIRKGLRYTPPPSLTPDFNKITAEEVIRVIRTHKKLIKGLIKGLGIPGEVAEEAIFRSGLNKETDLSKLNSLDIESILVETRNIIKESLEGKGYLVKENNEVLVEVDPFVPLRFKNLDNITLIKYETFDDALDDFFSEKNTMTRKIISRKIKLAESLKKAEETAKKYSEESERLKELAEKVAMNYEILDDIIKCVSDAYKKYNWKGISRCPGILSYDPSKGTYTVFLKENLKVEVKLKESVDRLILRLYAKAGEIEAKARRAYESINQIKEKLTEEEFKERSSKVRELIIRRKRKWFEKYHWLWTTNGFLAIGGKNAEQNESIVKKYLEPYDIFIHADIHGAPAVILKNKDKEPKVEDLIDAAYITTAYSKGWKAGIGSVPVWWVRGEQVSKSPPSGEYITKGSFMVYGKKNYLKSFQLKIALGIALDEENIPIIIVGPERLVKNRSFVYAVLIPGDTRISELVDELKKKLVRISPNEIRHLIAAIPLKDIEERIPGRSRILYVRRGNFKV